jgi:hypothetical protein
LMFWLLWAFTVLPKGTSQTVEDRLGSAHLLIAWLTGETGGMVIEFEELLLTLCDTELETETEFEELLLTLSDTERETDTEFEELLLTLWDTELDTECEELLLRL